jgi:hypothetical protein
MWPRGTGRGGGYDQTLAQPDNRTHAKTVHGTAQSACGERMRWRVRSCMIRWVQSRFGISGSLLDATARCGLVSPVMRPVRPVSWWHAHVKRAIGRQWLFLNGCDTWRCWSDWTHPVSAHVRPVDAQNDYIWPLDYKYKWWPALGWLLSTLKPLWLV